MNSCRLPFCLIPLPPDMKASVRGFQPSDRATVPARPWHSWGTNFLNLVAIWPIETTNHTKNKGLHWTQFLSHKFLTFTPKSTLVLSPPQITDTCRSGTTLSRRPIFSQPKASGDAAHNRLHHQPPLLRCAGTQNVPLTCSSAKHPWWISKWMSYYYHRPPGHTK